MQHLKFKDHWCMSKSLTQILVLKKPDRAGGKDTFNSIMRVTEHLIWGSEGRGESLGLIEKIGFGEE